MSLTAIAGGLSGELGEQLVTLGEVLMMDLVLAGDNAVAVGLAAAGLAPDQRKRAILLGLIAAVVLRCGLALITVQLLAVVGLLLAGGVLLLWVCWKMGRELRHQSQETSGDSKSDTPSAPRKSFGAALFQIMVADATMSLDNVLAVAGAAHEHPWVMVIGLVFSIALMGVAASYIAGMLHRFQWIGWLGLVIVLYVALHMIWDGGRQIIVRTGKLDAFNSAAPNWADISDQEAAHHRGRRRTPDSALPAPAEPSIPG